MPSTNADMFQLGAFTVPQYTLHLRHPALGWQVVEAFFTLPDAECGFDLARDLTEGRYDLQLSGIAGKQVWLLLRGHRGTHVYTD